MPLTADQIKQTKDYALKARDGDPAARHFFSELERMPTPLALEFLAVRDAHLSGQSGAAAAAAYGTYANGEPMRGAPPPSNAARSSADTVALDPNLLRRLALNETQMKDCREQTFLFAQGDESAISFFNGCRTGALKGSMPSAAMITMRDEILKGMGWTVEGNKLVPPRPAVASPAAPPSPASSEAKPATDPRFAVAPLLESAVPPSAVAPMSPTVEDRFAATPSGQPIEAPEGLGVLNSSGLVTRIPTFDMPGAAETIQEAIRRQEIFDSNCMQIMLNEVLHLQRQVALAIATQGQRPVPMATAAGPSANASNAANANANGQASV